MRPELHFFIFAFFFNQAPAKAMGWHQDNRIKRNVIHVRLKDEKIWIEEDQTEDGIATDLLQAGVSREDIVLAFHPPHLRQFTEFATA